MKKNNVLSVLVFSLGLGLLTGCASKAPLLQFQDIAKQEAVKNRVALKFDMDITPITNLEGVENVNVITVESFGKYYLTAVNFKNVYTIIGHNSKNFCYKVVKLKREKILPFSSVKFDWIEGDEISFIWQDSEGEHTNVINKKGKAIK